MLVAKLAVGTIHLCKDVTSINEEDFIFVGALLIEEPKSSRERNGREHIAWQSDHLRDDAILYHLLADFQLTTSCITCRVSHDKGSLTRVVESRGKVTYPEIIGIRHSLRLVAIFLGRLSFVTRHTISGESSIITNFTNEHFIHIEWRIRHHIVKLAKSIVRVAIIRICLCYLSTHIIEQ